MSLSLLCVWHSGQDVPIEEHMKAIAELLGWDQVAKIMGARWYGLGYSKREALLKKFPTSKVADPSQWKKVLLPGDVAKLTIRLWNGQDFPRGVGFSSAIYVDYGDPCYFGFRGPELSEVRECWDDTIRLAARIARRFRGIVRLRSNELVKWAEERSLENAVYAAYAVMTTPELGVKSAQQSHLVVENLEGAQCYIATPTWDDVVNPSEQRIQEVIEVFRAARNSDRRR